MRSLWGAVPRATGTNVEPSPSTGFLRRNSSRIRALFGAVGAAVLLAGCQMEVLNPKGPIASDEKDLILFATGLMLLVVIPVIVLTLVFAWRYRASNTKATYAPDWEHSGKIEAVVWLIPCAIIVVLATVTWITTHKLDPYRPLASTAKPLEVEVVSLDWKWLFIYPEQNVASVNELAIPTGTPVNFRLTSATVMNSFFIPQLGSQIYTMAGMETKLHLLASEPGDFAGISANYSGAGFSGMKFVTKAMSQADFDAWVAKARASSQSLDAATYRALEAPSENNAVALYGSVSPTLYHNILNKCADGAVCTDVAMNLALAKGAGTGANLCTPANPKGL